MKSNLKGFVFDYETTTSPQFYVEELCTFGDDCWFLFSFIIYQTWTNSESDEETKNLSVYFEEILLPSSTQFLLHFLLLILNKRIHRLFEYVKISKNADFLKAWNWNGFLVDKFLITFEICGTSCFRIEIDWSFLASQLILTMSNLFLKQESTCVLNFTTAYDSKGTTRIWHSSWPIIFQLQQVTLTVG